MGQVGVNKLTVVYNNIYSSHCVRTIMYILHIYVYVINKNMYYIHTTLSLLTYHSNTDASYNRVNIGSCIQTDEDTTYEL